MQTVKVLEGFSANDITSRREVLARLSVCTGSAVLQPVRRWVASLPWEGRGGAGMVEADEIAELEQAVTVFRRWDASGAGGLRRKAVVGQLNAVSETLRGPHQPPMRRRLFRITAELAQLAGWMAYDQGLFGAAQRYYLLALHACRQAARPALGAKVVGDMTQLSTALGRYHDSLDLVRAALSGLPRHANPLVQAELLGLEARAYAQLDSRHASAAAHSAAGCVETYQEATAGPVPDWLHYMTGAEVHCLAANTYIELALQAGDPHRQASYARQAETHTLHAHEQRGEHFTRSRIFDQLRLAKVRLAQHEPTESVAGATGALELAEPVRSSLVVTWLIHYHHEVTARHPDLATTAVFRDRLRDYLRRAAPTQGA